MYYKDALIGYILLRDSTHSLKKRIFKYLHFDTLIKKTNLEILEYLAFKWS